jgi:hypothetical protein
MLMGRSKTVLIKDRVGWSTGFAIDGRMFIVDTQTGQRITRYRLVMECFLGRPLDHNEVVHHKDGNHTNDAIENLEVMSMSDHIKHHVAEARAKGLPWGGRRTIGFQLRTERTCDVCKNQFPAWKATVCRKCAKREYDKARYVPSQRRNAGGAS